MTTKKTDLKVVPDSRTPKPRKPRGTKEPAPDSRTSQRENPERDAEALRLRMGGLTQVQVARQMGWTSHTTAGRAIQRAVDRAETEPDTQIIRLTLERFDAAIRGLMPGVMEGDTRAVTAMVKVEHERLELLGLLVHKSELTGRDGGPIRITSEEERVAWMKAAKVSLDRRLQAVE